MSELNNKLIEEEMNLINFRLWVLSSGDSLNYKIPGIVIKKGGISPRISDDDAIFVDKALGEVKRGHLRDYRILWKAYILDLEDVEIAEDMRLSANRVAMLRSAALKAWYYCWRGLTTQDVAV